MPVIVLLYASVLTTGYAFYNSYRNSNQNSWVYLTTGIYGVGTTIYIYLSVTGNLDNINQLLTPKFTSSFAIKNELGLYLTGLFSFFLFWTGFDKSDNDERVSEHEIDQDKNYKTHKISNSTEKLGRTDKPNVKDWLKENPGKSINDYYSKYGWNNKPSANKPAR